MRKALLLFLFAASALAACKKETCSPEQISSSYAENKKIVINYNFVADGPHYYQVEEGGNLVFQYNHTMAQCDDILDDEGGFNLIFEVEKDATAFRFTGSELASAKAVYREFGAWTGSYRQEIESGLIEGSRVSPGKWRVQANVAIAPLSPGTQPKQIVFDEIFEK